MVILQCIYVNYFMERCLIIVYLALFFTDHSLHTCMCLSGAVHVTTCKVSLSVNPCNCNADCFHDCHLLLVYD